MPSNRPDSQERGTGDPSQKPVRQSLFPSWIWWVLLLAILGWNAYALIVPKTPPAISLSYTAFLDQVKSGNVSAVTFKGQSIEGTFRQPIDNPARTSPPPGTGVSPTEPAAPSGPGEAPASFSRFTTVVPQQTDNQLMPLLEQYGVTVSAVDTGGGSWLLDLIISVLPMGILVFFLIMMTRQAQGGQQAVFGFTKSQARMYNQERPGVTFADVAGEDEAKVELMEVVDFLKNPARYRSLGARLPRGVLLVGPPGTGKTLIARAVAGEAHVPFFSISASEFVEMFVGVGARRVRDLFERAKAEAPAIVFVDELDAVGRRRGVGLGGGNDEREQTLNQLLVEMDGFDEETHVIIVAATNRPDVLDPALLRPGRFDRQVTVGLPDRAGREAILKIHTRPLRLAADIEPEVLARRTPGFSGADLANLANEAALSAARRGATEVHMRDFDEAMDKIVLGTRQAKLLSEEERRVVAYHEGGHALVAKLTPGADPISKVTIIPRGMSLGVTEQLPEEDRRNYLKGYLLGRLAVMLGGRAAEELAFGEPSTGAENDLKQATNLAQRMVGTWGMSDELGPVFYGIGESHPYLGRDAGQPHEVADATAAKLDAAVRRLIEQAHADACALLQRHRSLLDAIVNELLAHETVDGRWIDSLLENNAVPAPAAGDPADAVELRPES